MILRNKKMQKLLSSLIIVGFLLPSLVIFSIPRQANAIPVNDPEANVWHKIKVALGLVATKSTVVDTTISVKNVLKAIANEALKAAAKRALQQMTKDTVNWINGGFHGSPLFVENPKSFFNDIAKSEIKSLIDTFGYDSFMLPFGRQFALNTINAYKSQLEINSAYSLSLVTRDADYQRRFRANFNVGGWDGLLMHTQYPQNNAIGFQMLATEKLARELEDIVQNKAQETKKSLNESGGFLSPKRCLSNTNYDNDIKESNRPRFKFTPPGGLVAPDLNDFSDASEYQDKYDEYERQYRAAKSAAQFQYDEKNVCPGGLQTITPGAVVGSSIMNALTSGQRLTELQAAVGGSISAIFDAVLNKILGDGLTKLASKINPPPPKDNWDYFGNTLGSPSINLNDPFGGPDQEIILKKFKEEVSGKTMIEVTDSTGAITNQFITGNIIGTPLRTADGETNVVKREYIPGAIKRTQEELLLIDNSNSNSPGIVQGMTQIWQKTRELDFCLPGPDYKWEDRLVEEMNRNANKLQEKLSDSDGEKAYNASLAYKSLRFAVDSFKDWITTKIMTTLPSGIIFLDAVKELENLDQQSSELTDKRRVKAQTVTRLKAIEASLAVPAFATQPDPGSQQEKDLITIKKQYDAVSDSISNIFSIENTRTELDTLKDKLANLQKLVTQCTDERKDEGWNIPASGWNKAVGKTSILASEVGKPLSFLLILGVGSGRTKGTEMEQFCDLPIVSGYTHETFRSFVRPTMDIPMVNASNVLTWDKRFLGVKTGTGRVHIRISCNVVYQSHLLDYKGNIPGIVNIVDSSPLPLFDGDSLIPDPEEDEDTGEVIDPNLPPVDPNLPVM